MADIISFQKAKDKRISPENLGLNDLIRRASLICKEKLPFSKDELSIVGEERLKSIFERKIAEEIFSRRLIGSDIFLCGIYVSNLLAELSTRASDSWWAVDYIDSDDSLVLKKGGDTCFAICGVFPERSSHRLMNVSYYQNAGAGFYYHFYSIAGKEIGYHMSQQFETMASVVQSCIHNF